MTDVKKCALCGGAVRGARVDDKTFSFWASNDLSPSKDLRLPRCSSCDEVWLGPDDDAALNASLEVSFRQRAADRAREAAAALAERGLKRRRVESLLGLSSGYLSRLDKGKPASASLAAVLMLLADEPSLASRLGDLWQGDAFVTSTVFVSEFPPPLDLESGGFDLVAMNDTHHADIEVFGSWPPDTQVFGSWLEDTSEPEGEEDLQVGGVYERSAA